MCAGHGGYGRAAMARLWEPWMEWAGRRVRPQIRRACCRKRLGNPRLALRAPMSGRASPQTRRADNITQPLENVYCGGALSVVSAASRLDGCGPLLAEKTDDRFRGRACASADDWPGGTQCSTSVCQRPWAALLATIHYGTALCRPLGSGPVTAFHLRFFAENKMA